jgi:hypothetical protein
LSCCWMDFSSMLIVVIINMVNTNILARCLPVDIVYIWPEVFIPYRSWQILQSVLQTPYTATRVKNLIELGVITRNPKTLFKDNLLRKIWQLLLPFDPSRPHFHRCCMGRSWYLAHDLVLYRKLGVVRCNLKKLTVYLPPCCTLPVKCKQCQPVNILLVYWC